MKTIFGLIVLLAMVLTFVFIPAYAIYAQSEYEAFDELLLHKSADYAAEAAMAMCMDIRDIELQYSDENILTLSPIKATDTFAAMICISHNIPPTERNINEVLSAVPVMMLVENDGYYLGEQIKTNDEGDETLLWHIKRPHTIEADGYTYGVQLSMERWTRVNNTNMELEEGEKYLGLPFTREEMLQKINRNLNRDITAVLGRYAERNNKAEYQRFYLPFAEGKYGINRVERPTLIVVLNEIALSGKPLSLSVVSGLKAVQKQYIIGWTDGTGKWYKHEKDASEPEMITANLNGKIFENVEQAAKAGYLPKLS
jgi:hypothetical protein